MGKLTTKRYKYATVHVDQFSKCGYLWLQQSASVDDTLLGKKAFERWAANMGVTVRSYHADNGIFKAKEWVNNYALKQQRLTFAAVGAHNQSGLAKQQIRTLQDMTRINLAHA